MKKNCITFRFAKIFLCQLLASAFLFCQVSHGRDYTEINVKNGTGVLFPVFDTYIRGGNYASDTYYSEPVLMAKWASSDEFQREIYLKFKFSETNYPVEKAELKIYVSSAGVGTEKYIELYKSNFDKLDENSSWDNLGREASYFRNRLHVDKAKKWYSFDVTEEINWQIENTKTNEVVLRLKLNEISGSTANHWVHIASLEAGTSEFKPKLNIKLGDNNVIHELVTRDQSSLKFKEDLIVQDFSYAGYKRGLNIPTRVVKDLDSDVLNVNDYRGIGDEQDDTIAIQKAIDHAIILARTTGQQHYVYLPAKSNSEPYQVSLKEAQKYFKNARHFWNENVVTKDPAWISHYENSGVISLNQVIWIWGDDIVLKGDGVNKTKILGTQSAIGNLEEDYSMRRRSIIGVKPKNGNQYWASLNQQLGEERIIVDTRPIPLAKSVFGVKNTIELEGTYNPDDGSLNYNGNSLKRGDFIVVRSFATRDFINSHAAASWWRFWGADENGDYTQYRAKIELTPQRSYEYHYWVQGVGFLRRIENIQGNSVTLDSPIRYSLAVSSGAIAYKAKAHIKNIGIEDLSISNMPLQDDQGVSYVYQKSEGFKNDDYNTKGNPAYYVHNSSLINLNYLIDGWVKSVSTFDPVLDGESFNYLSNGIVINSSKNITIKDVKINNSQYLGEGGNGYAFTLMNANDCLLSNVEAKNYRHGFSISKSFSSGNVIYNSKFGAVASGSYYRDGSEMHDFQLGNDFHMWFSQSNLVDSVSLTNDFLISIARSASGGPGREAGRTSVQSIFWNIEGKQYRQDTFWFNKASKDPYQMRWQNSPWIVLSDSLNGLGAIVGTRGEGNVGRYNSEKYFGSHEVKDLILMENRADELAIDSLYQFQLERRRHNN
ncbi:CBM96 family carbohydrate-binding protein [Microbulbifer sp. DLAB2-AA]|uniref:CBM96 family carbohydrate-binding protein n=1 Tax=Microbulbifer sp. DLAB2-AA TaxID=3243394 RepID=UPI0040393916